MPIEHDPAVQFAAYPVTQAVPWPLGTVPGGQAEQLVDPAVTATFSTGQRSQADFPPAE